MPNFTEIGSFVFKILLHKFYLVTDEQTNEQIEKIMPTASPDWQRHQNLLTN